MDNPVTDSATAPLGMDEAAVELASLFSPAAPAKAEKKDAKPDDDALIAAIEPDAAASGDDAATTADTDPVVTVKVDGKERQVPMSEVLKGYQLAQASSERFEQAATARKEADALTAKATQERQTYANNLQRMQVQLEGALAEQQSSVDWDALLQSDPVEFLKQKHLAERRQAALQTNYAEQRKVAEVEQAETQKAYAETLKNQHGAMIAKIPEWADEGKAKAGKAALGEYLIKEGFDEGAVANINDAKTVVLARKAMLYDQLMSKASAAAKRVATLPTKVERPGVGDSPGLDRRGSAYQRLNKSGRVEDAAAVFASLLS